jgi:putative hemolysin
MDISKIVFLALALLAVPAAMGVPDPSSVYCDALGYGIETRTNPETGGEVGYCVFPDGSACPTWDFYRGKCGQNFTYCELQGNRIENRVEDMGDFTVEYAVCVFNDSSECGEQRYLSGECQPSDCSRWAMKDGCKPPTELNAPATLLTEDETDPIIFTWGISGREVKVNVPDKDVIPAYDVITNPSELNNTTVYIFAIDMSGVVIGAKEIVFFESLNDTLFQITDDQLFEDLVLHNSTGTVYIFPGISGKMFYDEEVSVHGAFFIFSDGCMIVKASDINSLKELLELIQVIKPEA